MTLSYLPHSHRTYTYKIINDTCAVSEKFNTFFSTVADKIGEDTVYDPTTHPSILEIKNHVDVEKNFEFFKYLFKNKKKKQEGHSQVYNLFYLMGHFSCVMVLPELF
jgi:hypothetical protein